MNDDPNRAQTKLNALMTWDNDLAKATVIQSAQIHHGVRKDMALDLGVSLSTLWRAIRDLDLKDVVDGYRKRSMDCPVCGGARQDDHGATCPTCAGSGLVRVLR